MHTPQQTAAKLAVVARQLEQVNRAISDIFNNASDATREGLTRLHPLASFEGWHLAQDIRALADKIDGEVDQARAA